MVRFSLIRRWKAQKGNANSDLSSEAPRVPRVSLPRVETHLDMHEHNGVFDESTHEQANGSAHIEESTGWLFLDYDGLWLPCKVATVQC